MSSTHLPKVSELPRPAAQAVMLGSIGSLLRAHYEGLRHVPLPEHLQNVLRQLS